ncbi:anti-repressor SinI family protein [Halobacillus naozhouensis]|uniref:Anti-repressor SinI family protein n=1 Tax=Halobacillus naozhouensis TaxID=554880 RepID=A0ABY8J1P8_9BACI|nr:anti-repressor SinI family protein [Halobacillus naozhouensis]WFT76006.1 anti-repressor SinI family protein [Halobacillus naozhouensis]
MESLKKERSGPLDQEWVQLLRVAKALGFSKKEIEQFITSHQKDKKAEKPVNELS